MVFQIFKTKKQILSPLFNEMGSGVSFDDMQRHISSNIFRQVKNTSALIGILDTIVTDHFLGPLDYFDSDGKLLGSTNLKRAKQFIEKNAVKSAFQGAGFDYFVDGSCFPWFDSLNFHIGAKEKEQMISFDQNYGGYYAQVARDQAKLELEKPRKISYLAASTTEILHDDTGVYGYKQEASGKAKIWTTDQVRHIKLINMNGEIRGWSGLKSLLKDIAIMYMIKENMLAKLGNGGSPDNIIFLKNATGMSKAKFQRLRTALESFSHLRKSHGNMPIDAEVGAIPLGASMKDMEYRELAMFAVSEFCLAIGMPTSRVNYLMTGSGGTSSKGELSGNSEDAYQKKINNRREAWETVWNTIFSKAGFTVKFRRDNLQDEVRETQAATQRTAYVQGVLDNLSKVNKQLSVDAILQLLSGTKKNLSVDDLEEFSVPEHVEDMMQQNDTPDKNDMKQRDTALKSRVSNDRMASKMRTASNNGVST